MPRLPHRLQHWAADKNKCAAAESDSDGDSIWDRCDNCPTVFNPEQLSTDDDPDKNGWGAACDFCPGTKYTWGGYNVGIAGNCNYEAELARFYPGETAPPVLGPEASTLAKSIYTLAFRPDQCDVATCPRQARSGGNLDDVLPLVTCLKGNPKNIPNCNCQIGDLTTSCHWAVDPNTLQLWPATHESAASLSPEGQKIGDSVKQGIRFCKCPGNVDPSTLAGRVQCQGQCPLNEKSYDGPSPWEAIATEPAANWPAPSDLGKEFSLTVSSLASADSASAKFVRWDFQKFNTIVPVLTYSPYGGLTSVSVNGILLSKIAAVDGKKVTAVEHPTFYKLAQTLQSGRAGAFLSANTILAMSIVPSWKFLIPTPGPGPDPYHLLGKAPGNANLWIATATGISPVGEASPGLSALFDDVASGNRIFVPASEMPATLARRTAAGEPLLRGVALDPVHPQVTAVYESATPDGLPALKGRDPCVPPRCSPVFKGNEAIVLSGSLRTLLVLGGTSDGTPNGVPNASSWLLNVDENAWTELPLALGARPGHLRSAVYRDHDMKVYFVELKNNQTRLLRYLPRGELKELAILPKKWGEYSVQYLVAGEAGDLVFAAGETPTGTEEHVLVCHHPSGKGKAKTLSVDPQTASELLNPGGKNGDDGNESGGKDQKGNKKRQWRPKR